MKEKPTTFQLAQLAAQAASHISSPKDAVKRAWALWREAEAEIAEHDNREEFIRGLFKTPHGKDIPIFSDSPEDWIARLKAYPGDERDVSRAMWDREFPNEEVQKQLFKDKKLTRDQRRQLVLGLAKASIHYDMEGPWVASNVRLGYLGSVDGEYTQPREGFPIHPKNQQYAEERHDEICRGRGKMLIPKKEVLYLEKIMALLAEPKLKASLVRWLVEVRQRQLARSKTRVIPQSIRDPRRERDADESIQHKRAYRA